MMAPEQCTSLYGFLVGIPLIESLHEMRPPLGGAGMEETYGIAKMREGYELCMANLVALANRGASRPIQSPFIDVTMHDLPVTEEAQVPNATKH